MTIDLQQLKKKSSLELNIPLMVNTSPSWVEALDFATPFTVKKHNTLSSFSSNPRDFFFVESGFFQFKYYNAQGKMRSTTCYGANTLISLAAAIIDRARNDTNTYCLQEGKVWRFEGKLLHDYEFYKKFPHLIHEALKHLSTNLMIHTVYTTNMVIDPPIERVARFILALFVEKDKKGFFPHFSHQEMAEMLSIHRVTFTRAIQKLKQENIISYTSQKELCVMDLEKLISFSGLLFFDE